MTVPPAGAGPTRGDLATPVSGVAAAPPRLLAALGAGAQASDSVGELLKLLSTSAVGELLHILDRPTGVAHSAETGALLQRAIGAVSEGRVERALVHLAHFAAQDPRRAEQLASMPELAAARPQVAQLMSRLTTTSRMEAESQLAAATAQLEAADAEPQTPAPGELTPRLALQLAGRLLESGGYANFVLSTQFSQLALSLYTTPVPEPIEPSLPPPDRPAPAAALLSAPARGVWAARLRHLWRRGPLLVLLLGWLALGLAGAALSSLWRLASPQSWPAALVGWAWDVWALGFLALVLFGFYVRLRQRRR